MVPYVVLELCNARMDFYWSVPKKLRKFCKCNTGKQNLNKNHNTNSVVDRSSQPSRASINGNGIGDVHRSTRHVETGTRTPQEGHYDRDRVTVSLFLLIHKHVFVIGCIDLNNR
ncbi:hypothetical protein JTB14_033803 [Gonioctena quinquepunctata]|nr:hypothetical protein JTB14_033803 [Gonioctena quinquepunctata]